MASRLNPYIGFEATRQAIRLQGGLRRPAVSTFGEFGAENSPDADKIMHSQLETDRGFTLMASDTPSGMARTSGDNITISLSGEDGGELRGYWDKLSDGGNVTMPLEKQMWGDEFGMVTDRFGIPWMVNITQPRA
jgi:PhnB protein